MYATVLKLCYLLFVYELYTIQFCLRQAIIKKQWEPHAHFFWPGTMCQTTLVLLFFVLYPWLYYIFVFVLWKMSKKTHNTAWLQENFKDEACSWTDAVLPGVDLMHLCKRLFNYSSHCSNWYLKMKIEFLYWGTLKLQKLYQKIYSRISTIKQYA